MLKAQPIEYRFGPQPVLEQLLDVATPVGHRRGLLRRGLRRRLLEHRCFQQLDRRDFVHRTVQQLGALECLAVVALGVGTHAEHPRCFAIPHTHAMQANQLLQPVHLNPPCGHRRSSGRAGSLAASPGTCRTSRLADPLGCPRPDPLGRPRTARAPQRGSVWPSRVGSAWPSSADPLRRPGQDPIARSLTASHRRTQQGRVLTSFHSYGGQTSEWPLRVAKVSA